MEFGRSRGLGALGASYRCRDSTKLRDGHKVTYWINRRMLKATRRGTARSGSASPPTAPELLIRGAGHRFVARQSICNCGPPIEALPPCRRTFVILNTLFHIDHVFIDQFGETWE